VPNGTEAEGDRTVVEERDREKEGMRTKDIERSWWRVPRKAVHFMVRLI